jgi:hypothetical protein
MLEFPPGNTGTWGAVPLTPRATQGLDDIDHKLAMDAKFGGRTACATVISSGEDALMKRLALFMLLCIVGAAVPVGIEAWHWRERKLKEDERGREQSAAENAAAGRLGLKTQPLAPHPFDRRPAVDDALRLEPDRRFLLAARELSGAEVAARFADGHWTLSAGDRDFARVAELPDFPELMNALVPIARDWVAAAKVTGRPPRIRALRGHKEAFAAVREAQTRWSRGDHAGAVLHDAASAAAALMLQVPRTFDADDRLDAHAIALCAADAAAGSEVRGEQSVLALALGYASAARSLAPASEEPALHAFVTLDRRKLSDLARRKDANAGERHLLLRWLVQDADAQAVLRFIASLRNEEHISIPNVGQLLLDADLQVVAAASDALPALALAELESVHPAAPNDVELVRTLMDARNSAFQSLGNNEDPRARLAADLRQADIAYEGPLWRGADTSAWYAAASASALLGAARSGLVLRSNPGGLADELGSWPVPVASQLSRWLKARTALDRGGLDDAYEVLTKSRLPGARTAADFLDEMAKQTEPPDPRMVEAVRLARRQFDSRPLSRLVWAEALRTQLRDVDRSGQLIASVVDDAFGAHPLDEVALAKQRGQLDRLEKVALDERFPFPARLEAAVALVDRGGKAQAERALRRLGRERPADVDTQERLIRFLHEIGRPAEALSTGLDLVKRYGEDDSYVVARARCAAARQLDAMGRHEEALAVVERGLPTEAVCAYRIATVQLAKLRRKEDAEGLLLAYLARHPQAETVATVAEVRWRGGDDAGAADIFAHGPVALPERAFREVGERFAAVFQGRPAIDTKRAIDALLQAGVQPESVLALGPALVRAGATAQAFELYARVGEKLPAGKTAAVQLRTWSALRGAKGISAAEAWWRKQAGQHSEVADEALAASAYSEGLDEALWELFPAQPADSTFAERLTLLRAASLVRRGERGARREAVLARVADPLAPWKARLARQLRLGGAYASWEVRLTRYLLGESGDEEIADDATDGSRPCEAPYYLALRAAAESRARDAASWYRVALECRNPAQPEFRWAWQAAGNLEPDRPLPAKALQASR